MPWPAIVLAVSDLFQDKAEEWDKLPVLGKLSAGVGAALLDKLDLRPDLRVMDFGAGTGLICAQLAPFVKTIYAVDISESMLEQLSKKPELKGKVVTFCQNILDAPLDEPVDLIVSAMALHHVEDTKQLFKVFAAHLPSGGRIALADLDSEDGSFHPADIEGVYHSGFDREALRGLLSASGFEDVQFTTAIDLEKNDKVYPIFLVTARKR